MAGPTMRIRFWRDLDGPEVDSVIDRDGCYWTIEVKWSEAPDLRDARHLRCFLDEYPAAANGFVVCRAPRRISASPRSPSWDHPPLRQKSARIGLSITSG